MSQRRFEYRRSKHRIHQFVGQRQLSAETTTVVVDVGATTIVGIAAAVELNCDFPDRVAQRKSGLGGLGMVDQVTPMNLEMNLLQALKRGHDFRFGESGRQGCSASEDVLTGILHEF